MWPIRQLGRMISDMSQARVAAGRIRYIMESETESDKPDGVAPPMDGDIVFDNVSFAYEGCTEVLSNISFTMKGGSTLGILGVEAGSGTGLRLCFFWTGFTICLRIPGTDQLSGELILQI